MKTRYNANIFLQIIHVAISTELAIIWKPKVFIHVKQNWMIDPFLLGLPQGLDDQGQQEGVSEGVRTVW